MSDLLRPFAVPGLLWLALAAPAAATAAFWLWRRRLRADAAWAAPGLWQRLTAGRAPRRRAVSVALLALAVLGAALALARPRWGSEAETVERRGVDLVFVLDSSLSMAARDVTPSRLWVAKALIRRLAEEMPGNRVALVESEGEGQVLTPLTVDAAVLDLLLDAVEPGSLPVPGTELAPGLDTALGLFAERRRPRRRPPHHRPGLRRRGPRRRAGAGGGRLREEGVVVAALGVGTPAGAPLPLSAAPGFSSGRRPGRGQARRGRRAGDQPARRGLARRGGARDRRRLRAGDQRRGRPRPHRCGGSARWTSARSRPRRSTLSKSASSGRWRSAAAALLLFLAVGAFGRESRGPGGPRGSPDDPHRPFAVAALVALQLPFGLHPPRWVERLLWNPRERTAAGIAAYGGALRAMPSTSWSWRAPIAGKTAPPLSTSTPALPTSPPARPARRADCSKAAAEGTAPPTVSGRRQRRAGRRRPLQPGQRPARRRRPGGRRRGVQEPPPPRPRPRRRRSTTSSWPCAGSASGSRPRLKPPEESPAGGGAGGAGAVACRRRKPTLRRSATRTAASASQRVRRPGRRVVRAAIRRRPTPDVAAARLPGPARHDGGAGGGAARSGGEPRTRAAPRRGRPRARRTAGPPRGRTGEARRTEAGAAARRRRPRPGARRRPRPTAAAAGDVEVSASLEPRDLAAGDVAVLTLEARGGIFDHVRFEPQLRTGGLRARRRPGAVGELCLRRRRDGAHLPSELAAAGAGRRTGGGARHPRRLQLRPRRRRRHPPRRGRRAGEEAAAARRLRPALRSWPEPAAPKVFLRAEAAPVRPWTGQQVLYSLWVYTQVRVASLEPRGGTHLRRLLGGRGARARRPARRDGRARRRGLPAQAAAPPRPLPAPPRPLRAGAQLGHLLVETPGGDLFRPFLARPVRFSRQSDAIEVEARPLPPLPRPTGAPASPTGRAGGQRQS